LTANAPQITIWVVLKTALYIFHLYDITLDYDVWF